LNIGNGNDVFIDQHLALNIGEKIRGYEPIKFDGGQFQIKDPMHSACAVLLVTGFGAGKYARYYGARLPSRQELIYLKRVDKNSAKKPMKLPTPVINYKPDSFGIRGVNQIAEWVRAKAGGLLVLGRSWTATVEDDHILKTSRNEYYTDTGFRIAQNVK